MVAATTISASSLELTIGICTPHTPVSRYRRRFWGRFRATLTIAAMPEASQARTMCSQVSMSTGLCSASMMMKSNPAMPSISAAAGDGRLQKVPTAASPALSFCLTGFLFTIPSLRRLMPTAPLYLRRNNASI